MHDPWLLGGHCAHSFDCEKWISGCGDCPYLEVQYALKRDTSHLNWLRKKQIYESCRLYVITPSQWLMSKVERSILKPAVIKSMVINNGVDQAIFCPMDKKLARAELGISVDDDVVMFAANGIRESIWKDYATMREAVGGVAQAMPGKSLRFIAVGENAPDEKIGSATITFIPHKSSEDMARYYQSADVYIHAARAENFPNTIVEALSCGTPVIATAVGGVPEQVWGLYYEGDKSGLNHYGISNATGILTPVGDVEALKNALCHVFHEPKILQSLSVSAAKDARLRFNIETIGNQYLVFFDEIIADWKVRTQGGATARKAY
jgi:glycosyltransferase involved in cell wall biosynthesis